MVLHTPTLYFLFMVVALVNSVSMYMAYVSVQRAGYFLYWFWYTVALFVSLLGLSIRPSFEVITASILSNSGVVAVSIFFIIGCARYNTVSIRVLRTVVTVLAVISVLSFLPGYLRPDGQNSRLIAYSFIMAAGHITGVVFLIRTGYRNLQAPEKLTVIVALSVALIWLVRIVLSLIFPVQDIISNRSGNFTSWIIAPLMTMLHFSLTVMSHARERTKLAETERALDTASFQASTSALIAGMTQELGSPAGNAILALSHYHRAENSGQRSALVEQAAGNIETITEYLERYRRLIDADKDEEKVIHLGDLLQAVSSLARRSADLSSISVELDPDLSRSPRESPFIRVRPAVLFQGLLAILEIAGRRNWIGSPGRRIAISCTGPLRGVPGTGVPEVHLSGVLVPPESQNPDDAETRDRRFFRSTCRTLEDVLDARITIDGSGTGLLTVSLPAESHTPGER